MAKIVEEVVVIRVRGLAAAGDPAVAAALERLRRSISDRLRRRSTPETADVVEAVKARVAVWKQEVYADGSRAWMANCAAGEVRGRERE